MLLSKLRSRLLLIIRDQEGVALVEFAILLPLLTILFMGIIEFGYIVKEWRRLNDLVEAQVLYLSASNGSSPTNAIQFMATSTASTNTIITAVAEVNSRIRAADATPGVTIGCSCPSGSGENATITFSSSYTLETCPDPPDKTCGGSSYWHVYADVRASKDHTGFFKNSRWLPKMSAHALVRIY